MRDGDDARGASRPAAPGQPPGFSERSQLRGGARRGPPITPTNTHPGGTKGGAGARHQRAEGLWDASSPPKLSTSQGADFWRCLCYRGWVTALPAGSPSCCDVPVLLRHGALLAFVTSRSELAVPGLQRGRQARRWAGGFAPKNLAAAGAASPGGVGDVSQAKRAAGVQTKTKKARGTGVLGAMNETQIVTRDAHVVTWKAEQVGG